MKTVLWLILALAMCGTASASFYGDDLAIRLPRRRYCPPAQVKPVSPPKPAPEVLPAPQPIPDPISEVGPVDEQGCKNCGCDQCACCQGNGDNDCDCVTCKRKNARILCLESDLRDADDCRESAEADNKRLVIENARLAGIVLETSRDCKLAACERANDLKEFQRASTSLALQLKLAELALERQKQKGLTDAISAVIFTAVGALALILSAVVLAVVVSSPSKPKGCQR